jgi:hypothetical protein
VVSAERFTKPGLSALQGSSIRLSKRHAEAIAELAGSLPPANPPQRSPNPRGETEIAWTGKHGLEPEKIIEDHIAGRRKLWETLGFPEAPRQQQQLPSRRRPDLLSPGVVGDVKRRIRANDGPAQIERYVAELEDTRPDDGPWRAVLVHSQPDLDEAARACITASKVDIAVWGLTRDRRGRHTLRKLN